MGHLGMLSILALTEDIRGLGLVGTIFFLSVVMVSGFSFISIALWSDARRKEREAYYKAESMRRIGETSGEGAKYLIEMMREDERIRLDRERRSDFKKMQEMKMGGLVTIGVGAGLMIFLFFVASDEHGSGRFAYLVGLIPGLIGVALLISGTMLAPREPRG